MFQHFIITPFSFRSKYHTKKRGQDPLKCKNLIHRFKMFETACLPSVLSQQNKDFTWVFIIDPALPERFFNNLKKLTSPCRDVQFYVVNSDTNFQGTNWLKPYIHPGTQYVITSELDDDDAIFSGFTHYLNEHLRELHKSGKLPVIKFFGCKSAVLWDFFHTKNAPYGFKKPYPDYFKMPVSVGHSVCCKYPELDLTIRRFPHIHFDHLAMTDMELQALDNKIAQMNLTRRNLIREMAKESLLNWDGELSKDVNFHNINTPNAQAVLINHFDNIQYFRIFTNSKFREPVRDENTFPGITIDLTHATEYIRQHKRSFSVLFKAIKNALFYNNLELRGTGVKNVLKDKIKRILNVVIGVYEMPK